jgi:adenosylmethionine-8-amino-7-oxononanoate aminotransferase
MTKKTLQDRDLQNIWHPFDQAKHTTIIPIVRGEGVYVFDEEGNRYIDGFSSWWVNLHGHAHAELAQTLFEQATKLEHVAFGGFTHEKAIVLAEKLLEKLPDNLGKVFFSDNGSTANEVAIKIALHYFFNTGTPKTKIIALENAYHGDTFGGMSVTGRGTFNAPFETLLFDVGFLPIPFKENREECLNKLRSYLKNNDVAAFIFEPLVQGAGGMTIYDSQILDELIAECKANNVLTIADEVMTGFGRTGSYFAIDLLTQQPDMVCLSKGITGGFMPLGVTVVTNEIYNRFYSDNKSATFLHGHSYTGNALACALAVKNMEIMERTSTWVAITMISLMHKEFYEKIKCHPKVIEVRVKGTILAIELRSDENTSYFNPKGKEAYHFLLQKGIIMRPLGNVLVLLPPYCISREDLEYVYTCLLCYLNE